MIIVFITTTNNNVCPLNSQSSSLSEMCFFKIIIFLQKLGVQRTGHPDLYCNRGQKCCDLSSDLG